MKYGSFLKAIELQEYLEHINKIYDVPYTVLLEMLQKFSNLSKEG